MNRLTHYLPLALFIVLVLGLFTFLDREESDLRSVLLNKDFPNFSLSRLDNGEIITKDNLIENTMGTDLNRLLGNIIIQPYVKIIDILEGDVSEKVTLTVKPKITALLFEAGADAFLDKVFGREAPRL